MDKRVIAAISAGVLALLGVLVLVVWANGANARAYSGAKLTTVMRVTSQVAAGTSAADLSKSVESTKLPAESVPSGAVTSLADIAGLTTTSQLEKGEILLKARLAIPGSTIGGKATIPSGLQEVSVSLDTSRLVGGALHAGDHVGILASYGNPDQTNLLRSNVLVTEAPSLDLTNKGPGNAIITFAVSMKDAEKIVNAAQYGSLWLTKQNASTDTSGAAVVTRKDLIP